MKERSCHLLGARFAYLLVGLVESLVRLDKLLLIGLIW